MQGQKDRQKEGGKVGEAVQSSFCTRKNRVCAAFFFSSGSYTSKTESLISKRTFDL